MAETGNLPSLPTMVSLDENAVPADMGDPLEFMRKVARQYIDAVMLNQIPNENEKIEFKKLVLSKLKINIAKFEEIDVRAAKKAEEKEAAKAAEEASKNEEAEDEDPFADIFADDKENAEPDEFAQEKVKIATQFTKDLKAYKEKFLKDIRINREHASKRAEEEKLENILEQLETN
ncbi:hypothetical protein KKD70_04880 [Patescibacteria group bacterium]|nr:hypothetical protein [Patescibacteria group bacterium]